MSLNCHLNLLGLCWLPHRLLWWELFLGGLVRLAWFLLKWFGYRLVFWFCVLLRNDFRDSLLLLDNNFFLKSRFHCISLSFIINSCNRVTLNTFSLNNFHQSCSLLIFGLNLTLNTNLRIELFLLFFCFLNFFLIRIFVPWFYLHRHIFIALHIHLPIFQ